MDAQQYLPPVREVFSSNVSLNLVTSHVGRNETVHRTSKTRDSSADSGIHPASNTSPTLSVSDTDTEILEAFSSKPLLTLPEARLGTHETNNLVEEAYFAQDSLQHIDVLSERPRYRECNVVQKDKTYHASPFFVSEESISNSTDNIKINSRVMQDILNLMPSRSLKPIYTKKIDGCDGEKPNSFYVNQLELESKIVQIPISSRIVKGWKSSAEVDVVVAIDLGTTYSGYAYSRHFDKEVHMMRKWEGGDPGLNNQKIPTTILLSPEGKFHSFGFEARDFFHDLEPDEASRWFYFDKFKKTLHVNPSVRQDTKVLAANGGSFLAVDLFSLAIRYLSQRVLAELVDQGSEVTHQKVRWVITVPAIWSHAAKQLVREAAYKAGICSKDNPDALIIALEPEAAAVWCKNLRFDQLEVKQVSKENYMKSNKGSCFMVVDCGGGTVDVTVHKLFHPRGPLKELYKASGEPCGSLGIDEEFDRLLGSVFGFTFMTQIRRERPAAYTELMLSFESRKRSILPSRSSALNVSLPFAFIDFYQRTTGRKVKDTIKEYNEPELSWSAQGMLRISHRLMAQLFKPTIDNIIKHVTDVLGIPEVAGLVTFLFLVGGFAECAFLQEALRTKLSELKIPPPIIPQGVALCVVKGAVLFGMNPEVVAVRKSQRTYGIGVLKPFVQGNHPLEKLVLRDNREWCADVFDTLVNVDQDLYAGESVLRRYTPANPSQTAIVLHIYSSEAAQPKFVTDEGVQRVGTLKLDLSSELGREKPREILTRLILSSTELTVSAMDLETANFTDTSLTFLS